MTHHSVPPDSVELEKLLKQKQIEKVGHEIQKINFDIHQQAGLFPRAFDVFQKTMIPLLVAFVTWFATNAQIAPLKAEKNEAKVEAKAEAEKATKETKLKTDAYEKMENLSKKYEKTIELSQTESGNGTLNSERAILLRDITEIKKSSPVFLKQIFIQFRGDIQREEINRLRYRLGENGFSAPPAERLSNISGNEIRYFIDSPDERQRADQTMQIIKDFFSENKCAIDIKVKLIKLPSDKQSPLEAWLYPICR